MKPLLLVLLVVIASGATAAPRLTVLDVGEGQAVLLHEGGHGILIDTGHPGMARHVLQRLSALGVEQLDYLILTHLHPDHAGGYFRLREQFPEAVLLYTGHPLPPGVRPDLTRWLNQAIMADTRRRRFLAGDTLRWRGATLEALWPTSFSDANLNRHSLVLMIHYWGVRLLLMGDADVVVERALLERGRLSGPVDLLVAGHHGAGDATSEGFLATIRPGYAVISVNSDNIRGYPAAAVVERLERSAGRLLRTDRDGELQFLLVCPPSPENARCRIELSKAGEKAPTKRCCGEPPVPGLQ